MTSSLRCNLNTKSINQKIFMPQPRLPRFEQPPDKVPLGQISERCVDIIAAIENYGVISTSLLEALIGGDLRHTQDLLKKLFHHDYLKRFSLGVFGPGSNEIFCYLDNRKAPAAENSAHAGAFRRAVLTAPRES